MTLMTDEGNTWRLVLQLCSAAPSYAYAPHASPHMPDSLLLLGAHYASFTPKSRFDAMGTHQVPKH